MIDFIRDTIRERGPVPFAWFMQQALYHPGHGYYSSGRCAIGRGGDYFTSVSIGPLFGRLLAAQFAEIWEALGCPVEFSIVEQGAHGGEFAQDVLGAAQRHHHGFFEALSYRIIEPFPALELRQAAALAGFSRKVSWRSSLADLKPFEGVHFSNELIDALPVHLVKWTGHEWLERHVTEGEDAFELIDLPFSTPELADRAATIPLPLPAGYETEINLAALRWIEALAPKLERGFVIAVDYGYARDEFFALQRTSGTLRAYARHRFVTSPLTHVGQADLSAHVEWTSLAEHAARCGCALAGFTDQHRFITGLLAGPLRDEFASGQDAKAARELQTLLHPEHLGMKFQFLMLAKGIEVPARLSGLRFARDPRPQLSHSLTRLVASDF